ncbi:MAG: hypothetical protein HZA54_20710 [Planctomycetes bacterium]|nr:hypothetical protein [Planctomycetota bacterium]
MVRLPRSAATAVLAAVAALLCLGGLVRAEDGYRIERKLWKGQRLHVDETSVTTFDFKARAAGINGDPSNVTSQTGESTETKTRIYSQVMTAALADGGFRIERTYEKAIKESAKGGSAKKDTVGSSLHGKTVVLEGRGTAVRIDSAQGEINQDDKNDAAFAEKLYGLLPDKPVKRGETWTVPPEVVGQIFFGPLYNPVGFKAESKGRLRDLVTIDGRRAAQVYFTLQIGVQRTEDLPGLSYQVEGLMAVALEDGTILSLDLAGPVELEIVKGASKVKVNGKTSMRYRAKILERGEAP